MKKKEKVFGGLSKSDLAISRLSGFCRATLLDAKSKFMGPERRDRFVVKSDPTSGRILDS